MMLRFGLILSLALVMIMANEEPDPAFHIAGESLEMGFCFGADYIAVYRITDRGKLLLGNSSDPLLSPESYRNRINFSHDFGLGMRIEDLRASDSGVYESECWVENRIRKHHQRRLYFCNEKNPFQEFLTGQNGDAKLVCNTSNYDKESRSIKWFGENGGYKTVLISDSKISLEILQEDQMELFQVQDDGASLYVLDATQSKTYRFYCLVMDGEQCKSFQDILLQENINTEPVFFGLGEKAVLPCISTHLNQKKSWKTPVGEINATSQFNKETMYISNLEEPEDYSLVIPNVTTDHTGIYKCFSPSLHNQYSMTVCSKLLSGEIQVNIGETVTLNCSVPSLDSANFVWYRERNPNEIELLYDFEGLESSAEAMNDRMNISESDASLTITDFAEHDTGTYWCVVLMFSDVQTDNNIEDESDDDYTWLYDEGYICSLKQKTQLNINPGMGPESRSKDPESNPVPYAAIGGVLGVVFLGLIITVVLLRIKSKRKAVIPNGHELVAEINNGSSITPFQNLNRNSEEVY